MSLKMQCADCKKTYKVEDSWAGKRVKCKACGNTMVVPTPVAAVEEPAWGDMGGMESAVTPPPLPAMVHQYAPAMVVPPPAYADVASEATPYVTIPGEDLIDRWVPWLAIGLLLLDVLISGLIGFSRTGSSPALSGPVNGVVVIIVLMILLAMLVAATAASGALMLLGVYISSQIMKFPNHRLLYWRCIAAAGTVLTASMFLKQIGLDMSVARFFLAIVFGTGVLWVMLRLRGPQFALAGGLALLLGVIIPGGILLGLDAALASLIHKNPAMASGSTTMAPSITSNSGFGSSLASSTYDPRTPLRQTSAAHLKQINQALVLYAQDHQNAGPRTPEELVSTENLQPENLIAPGGLHYRFLGYGPQEPASAVVMYEVGNRKVLGGVTVLFKDGTIQFFPDNSADAVIMAQANYANNSPANIFIPQTPQPPVNLPVQPHRVVIPQPGINPLQPRIPLNRPPVDATAMLQKVAPAYQSYFTSHNSTYPRSVRDLLSTGLLKPEDLQLGTGQGLRSTINLPKVADLPAEVIVAYVLDSRAGTYTVLFGDWHIQSMPMADFRDALTKSRKALTPQR